MKKLLTLLIVLVGLSIMSCTTIPNEEQVNTYWNETQLFECKIVYLNEPSYNDTARFKYEFYYILGKDVYDVQRLFEEQLTERINSLNGAEVYWQPVPITARQDYPYPE